MEALWTNVSETRPSSDLASCIKIDRIKHWWRPCGQIGLVSETFVHKASISVLFYQTWYMMLGLMKVLSLKHLSTRPPSVFYSINLDTWTRPSSDLASCIKFDRIKHWWRPCGQTFQRQGLHLHQCFILSNLIHDAMSDEGLVSETFVHKASISVLFYQIW
jgi:hypothetical protein